jgi:hypothetical protein
MITDINNYEAIFFDFDDTLCIHSNHIESDFDRNQYNIGILAGKYNWSNCSTSMHMKKFIKMIDATRIPMYLISATISSVHANTKVKWVKNKYGVKMHNYCVGRAEDKIEILKSYCEANKIKYHELLYIDDYADLLEEAAKCGFHACSPMEVVNYVNNSSDK